MHDTASATYPLSYVQDLAEIWPQLLDAAARKAVAEGRHELAEYLRLRATNDAIRSTAAKWLLRAFVDTLPRQEKFGSRLSIEMVEPFSFRSGNSTMVGNAVEAKLGVRKLTIAVGWPRTPSHGILLKQSLAMARITHFGMSVENEELRLVYGEGLPKWIGEDGGEVDAIRIGRHTDLFLN